LTKKDLDTEKRSQHGFETLLQVGHHLTAIYQYFPSKYRELPTTSRRKRGSENQQLGYWYSDLPMKKS
jgi:hypothetical protein